ncbi:helix-turn-helix transcriptional regulator [bacterium]|nr:helix-turn-helix transcriptional regulator [bacterium]
MEDIKKMQADISKLEKDISLNQMAKRSGINYVTLMNIKKNKSKRVTDGVKKRWDDFVKAFTGGGVPATGVPAAKTPAKRGPKPGSKRATKKAGRKKAVKKAAAKKATKKAVARKAAAKKPGRKPGPKPGSKKKAVAAAPASVPSKLDFASPVLGNALDREIEIAEARLEYLKSLREIEDEFLKAVGRK